MYVRDVNLDPVCAKQYKKDMIIMERGFTDASSRVMGMKTTHRFAILSNHMADFSVYEHDTCWGLFVAQSFSHFLVLDVYEYEGKTQILLLHLPNDKRWKMFRNIKCNVLNDIIKDSRTRFENKCLKEPVAELVTSEWLERCSAPLGMDDYGNLFDLEVSLEHKLKKIGEASFRELLNEIIYIKCNDKILESLSNFTPVQEDDDGFLAFGYIDDDAGFSFRILCTANIKENQLSLSEYNEKIWSIIRKSEVNEFDYITMAHIDMDFSRFNDHINIIKESYKCKGPKTEEMRAFTLFDKNRNIDYPDDIQVILVAEGLEPEGIWVKCWDYTKDEFLLMCDKEVIEV